MQMRVYTEHFKGRELPHIADGMQVRLTNEAQCCLHFFLKCEITDTDIEDFQISFSEIVPKVEQETNLRHDEPLSQFVMEITSIMCDWPIGSKDVEIGGAIVDHYYYLKIITPEFQKERERIDSPPKLRRLLGSVRWR